MKRYPFPTLRPRVIGLLAFVVAEGFLVTGTWQFAFLAGFVAGMFSPRSWRAVALGGFGVAAAWAAYLAYVFVTSPAAPLASLVGTILGVGADAWWFLTSLTLVLGFLLGAVGGLTGYTASRLFLWEEAPAGAEAPKA